MGSRGHVLLRVMLTVAGREGCQADSNDALGDHAGYWILRNMEDSSFTRGIEGACGTVESNWLVWVSYSLYTQLRSIVTWAANALDPIEASPTTSNRPTSSLL
jgi:hypothetical protein